MSFLINVFGNNSDLSKTKVGIANAESLSNLTSALYKLYKELKNFKAQQVNSERIVFLPGCVIKKRQFTTPGFFYNLANTKSCLWLVVVAR